MLFITVFRAGECPQQQGTFVMICTVAELFIFGTANNGLGAVAARGLVAPGANVRDARLGLRPCTLIIRHVCGDRAT